MAKKDKKSEIKKKLKTSRMPFSVRFAFFMLPVAALVFLPSTIVFSVCMIPTLVAAIVDNHQQKTAWLTVGAMNLAGTVPIWFSLWDTGHTVPVAFQLVSTPGTIFLSYGGAVIGWIIYYNVTPFVAAIVLGKNEARYKAVERRQKELIKKWGEDVVSN
ncbi:MAG: hypothetical protein KAS59_01365 [Alphaproteobacteria bacterium]|nr:hypothetical protein [Alphaproteobacteria bacterium]